MSKTICLNMIVKDESHIIEETLNNITSYIDLDYWVISDTGSTDNTKEIIKDFFEKKKIKGELQEDLWKDFGHNRTLALNHAYNKSDYIFLFDADDLIMGNLKINKKDLNYDRYDLRIGKDFTYLRPLLFTNRKKWKYVGIVHEYLSPIEPINSSITLVGDYHIESRRLGNRSNQADKYHSDAVILSKAFEEEKDEGLKNRYAFYAAQSYKDSNQHDEAIKWYVKVLGLNNWTQEKYHTCLMLGTLYNSKNDFENTLKYLLAAYIFDNERLEGVVIAMELCFKKNLHVLVNIFYNKYKDIQVKLKEKLFVTNTYYDNHMEFYNSISSYYINDKKSGYECIKKIILNNKIDQGRLILTLNNLAFYENFMKEDSLNIDFFNKVNNIIKNKCSTNNEISSQETQVWNILFEKFKQEIVTYKKYNFINKKNPKIFISFTTCKRFDLFRQTINSILNNWLDYDKIDYWFCVDDNSDKKEREYITKMYHWIDYYMKKEEEKGHLKSMNIIYDKLKELQPDYWIHIEDDFLFFDKMNYIEEGLKGLEQLKDKNVKQLLFNRSYGETIDNYNIISHQKINEKFCIHDFIPDKKVDKPHCYYWPNYSFRPSIIDVKTILELGNFDSEQTFFEMSYAHKWTNAGYKSGFFNKITNIHIGRLTKDRFNKNEKNAYELNNIEQFTTIKKKDNIEERLQDKIQDKIQDKLQDKLQDKIQDKLQDKIQDKLQDKIIIKKNESTSISKTTKITKIKIINLKKRTDRKKEMIKKLEKANIKDYEFIEAVNGYELEATQEIYELFKDNDFAHRKGVIGCALSHVNIWKQLIDDKDNNYYLICEDDNTFNDNFGNKIKELENQFETKEVLFLGYHMFSNEREKYKDIYNNSTKKIEIQELNKQLYIGGYFCYSINKKGANKLLNYIEQNGIKHGIDYLNKIIPDLNNYELYPQIVFSDWNEHGKKIDSDIQNRFDVFDFLKFQTKKDYLSIEKYNKFVFISQKDQFDYDLCFHKKPLEELMQIALNDKKCVGFNSLGFMKSKIVKLEKSPYFKENDGIYIKKDKYENYLSKKNKIRVKLLCNWCTSGQLVKEWSNMFNNKHGWNNLEITWEDTNINYYVIINKPLNINDYYEPKKTIVFQMEPWVYDINKKWGVKNWGIWAIPDTNTFLDVIGRNTNDYNNVFWQLELNYNDLKDLKYETKLNRLSSICSSKYFDEGHIARIDFLKYLENKNDIELDIYNEDNNHNFKNYRGKLSPYIDKSKGLVPYKYYFMVENNYENNFITEKLWEPILCETLCFYYGCHNVSDYINSQAYMQLDMNDFSKSYEIIKNAITEDLWSKRIDKIKEEKLKLLNKMQFYPRLENMINKQGLFNFLKK